VPGLTTTSDAAAVESRPRRSRAKAARAPVVESKPTEPVEPQPDPVAPSEPELVFSHGSDDAVAKALVALEGTRAPRRRRAASRPAG